MLLGNHFPLIVIHFLLNVLSVLVNSVLCFCSVHTIKNAFREQQIYIYIYLLKVKIFFSSLLYFTIKPNIV